MRNIRSQNCFIDWWRRFCNRYVRSIQCIPDAHSGENPVDPPHFSTTVIASQASVFQWRAPAAVLLVLLLLSGCSSRFLYNNLDWLAYWFVDDYVDFHLEQKELFSPKIERLLAWHRAEALPEYLQLLTEVKSSVAERNLQSQQLARWLDQAKEFWQEMILESEPLILAAADSASEKQIVQLLRNLRQELEEKQQELDKDLLEKSQTRRQKKLEESFEKWLGSLSESQKMEIQALIKQTSASRQQWLDYRRRWVDELEVALNSAKEEGEFIHRLQMLIRHPYELRSPEYKAQLEADRLLWIERMPSLFSQISDKQHTHLQKKLEELSDDISYLIASRD